MADTRATKNWNGFLALLLLVACGSGPPGTELIRAARHGDPDTIRLLLQQGADPDQRGGGNDWTPLMHAIHKNQKQAVPALIEGGANVNARNRKGLTALIMAAGYGYSEIVRELLSQGADPYLETEDSDNALAAAVAGVTDIDRFTLGSCQGPAVAALLEHAPELQLPDDFPGRSARWIARLRGCSKVLEMIGY